MINLFPILVLLIGLQAHAQTPIGGYEGLAPAERDGATVDYLNKILSDKATPAAMLFNAVNDALGLALRTQSRNLEELIFRELRNCDTRFTSVKPVQNLWDILTPQADRLLSGNQSPRAYELKYRFWIALARSPAKEFRQALTSQLIDNLAYIGPSAAIQRLVRVHREFGSSGDVDLHQTQALSALLSCDYAESIQSAQQSLSRGSTQLSSDPRRKYITQLFLALNYANQGRADLVQAQAKNLAQLGTKDSSLIAVGEWVLALGEMIAGDVKDAASRAQKAADRIQSQGTADMKCDLAYISNLMLLAGENAKAKAMAKTALNACSLKPAEAHRAALILALSDLLEGKAADARSGFASARTLIQNGLRYESSLLAHAAVENLISGVNSKDNLALERAHRSLQEFSSLCGNENLLGRAIQKAEFKLSPAR